MLLSAPVTGVLLPAMAPLTLAGVLQPTGWMVTVELAVLLLRLSMGVTVAMLVACSTRQTMAMLVACSTQQVWALLVACSTNQQQQAARGGGVQSAAPSQLRAFCFVNACGLSRQERGCIRLESCDMHGARHCSQPCVPYRARPAVAVGPPSHNVFVVSALADAAPAPHQASSPFGVQRRGRQQHRRRLRQQEQARVQQEQQRWQVPQPPPRATW
jgi:hypothetical protein